MQAKLLILVLSLLLGTMTHAQTYYVKENQTYEQPIIDKLIELNQKVTTKRENSEYTIECIVEKSSTERTRGHLIIIDTKTGDIIATSAEEKGGDNQYTGKKAGTVIMQKIAKNELATLLLKSKR